MLRVKEIKNNNNGTIYLDPYYIDYLCFTDASGSSNTLTLTKTDGGRTPVITLEYSTDKVNWTTWTESNNVRTYTIPANGKVYLRGVNPNGICYNGSNKHTFSSTKNVRASGNIMTIADGVGRRTDITRPFFSSLFMDMTTLLTAPNFPSGGMKLGDSSITRMFSGCTNLTNAPSITISSMATGWCCARMFTNCSSLTDVSNIHLNSTNIPQESLIGMFEGCSSLTTPPTITSSALTIASGGLNAMFKDCTNLTNTPSITISSMTSGWCCQHMFENCTSLTDASNVHLNATIIPTNGYNNMFRSCTSLTTAPSFTTDGITLNELSMGGMFRNTALTTAPSVKIVSEGNQSTDSTFRECSSLTSAANFKLNATSLGRRTCYTMFQDCVNLVTPPEIMATSIYGDSTDSGYGSLAGMFRNCSKLSTIKVHFTSWNTQATQNWTYGTKSTGTFYKPSSLPSTKNASGNTTNPDYIPYNWTVTNI